MLFCFYALKFILQVVLITKVIFTNFVHVDMFIAK
jgi:hypothetical protein